MAIGIDIGAHGALTCDDGHRLVRHRLLPSHERVVFDLLPRVGDQTPMIFWDEDDRMQRIQADQLFVGEILRALMASGHDASAGDGRGVAVTVPGWWTTGATSPAVAALRAALGPRVTVLSDAEAAIHALHAENAVTEDTVAVLDVGARTTSAGIVEQCRTGRPHQVGRSLVQIDGSGDDLDTGIAHHVLAELRQHDPTSGAPSSEAARALRLQCSTAKHQLSTDSATTFEVDHGELALPIRLVRDELDEIALPWARSATRLLAAAIEAGGREVRAVAIVGGGAHVPLIAQTISAELGLDVLLANQPETLVARGASYSVAGVSHQRTARRRVWPALFARAGGRRRSSSHARLGPRRSRPTIQPAPVQTSTTTTAPSDSRTTSQAS